MKNHLKLIQGYFYSGDGTNMSVLVRKNINKKDYKK